MKSLKQFSSALLLSALVLPFGVAEAVEDPTPGSTPSLIKNPPTLIARGGARVGGGGGGGGARIGSGGGHRVQTGFQSAGGGLNRGSAKPTGGWSNKVSSDRARPSLDRPKPQYSANRDGSRQLNRDGSRDFNRDVDRNVGRDLNRNLDRDVNRNVNRDISRNVNRDINRNWNRRVDVDRVNLYPGWARPGWGVARPWNYGWYGGWNTPSWGWWGARAAAWGIGTLATAAIINDAVDDAVDDHVSYIVVPNTNYQLLYGTISPSGSAGVMFDVTAAGATYQLMADCNRGTLNGQDPQSAAEAELLNAACQVAYGSA